MDTRHDNAQQDAIFVRNFGLVLALLTFTGIVVAIIARWVYHDFLATTQVYEENLDARIAPVGTANTSGETLTLTGTAPASDAAAPAVPVAASSPGEATYNKVCFACHAQAVAGAPKFGDAAAWGPRIAKGVDVLHKHALEGFQGEAGIMPPKGGGVDLPDADVEAAVDFMIKAAAGGGAGVPAAAPAPPTAATDTATPTVAAADKGKQVYDSVCFACHTPGAAGAPKFGDAAAWGPRIAKGVDVLHDHSLNGFMGEAGLMPPKGGRPDFPDADVIAAADYMIEHGK
ncbi:MAG: cytochrome c5 family protein [Gammaproteobacteria bacterium]|nr:cytochrome c5 family protein [Gammaproteobacteria bacterium]